MSPTAPWAHKRVDAERVKAARQSPALKKIRIQRGFTQRRLAELCGMHRNSIQNIERGRTQAITAENAQALSKVLKVPVEDLGVSVRSAATAPSIRLRKLTPEQRQIVNELLSLPAEDYGLVRAAIGQLRRERRPKRRERESAR